MYKKKSLNGETIVFTGSAKPQHPIEQARAMGGKTIYLPLIETSVRQTEKPDFGKYGWLIFTSRTSAEAFCQLQETSVPKLAAVGEKTAEILQQQGYHIDFMPTVYSADVFAKEFPAVAGDAKCLFIKGSLAKTTITDMPMPVDEWVIYDTQLKIGNAEKLAKMKNITVIFASPSAVSAYRQAGGDWQNIRIAAIGHITEKAILEQGGHVDFVPEKYTYMNVINEIAKGSCINE